MKPYGSPEGRTHVARRSAPRSLLSSKVRELCRSDPSVIKTVRQLVSLNSDSIEDQGASGDRLGTSNVGVEYLDADFKGHISRFVVGGDTPSAVAEPIGWDREMESAYRAALKNAGRAPTRSVSLAAETRMSVFLLSPEFKRLMAFRDDLRPQLSRPVTAPRGPASGKSTRRPVATLPPPGQSVQPAASVLSSGSGAHSAVTPVQPVSAVRGVRGEGDGVGASPDSLNDRARIASAGRRRNPPRLVSKASRDMLEVGLADAIVGRRSAIVAAHVRARAAYLEGEVERKLFRIKTRDDRFARARLVNRRRQEFKRDLRRTKRTLWELAQQAVIGVTKSSDGGTQRSPSVSPVSSRASSPLSGDESARTALEVYQAGQAGTSIERSLQLSCEYAKHVALEGGVGARKRVSRSARPHKDASLQAVRELQRLFRGYIGRMYAWARKYLLRPSTVRGVFNRADEDGDGALTATELLEVLLTIGGKEVDALREFEDDLGRGMKRNAIEAMEALILRLAGGRDTLPLPMFARWWRRQCPVVLDVVPQIRQVHLAKAVQALESSKERGRLFDRKAEDGKRWWRDHSQSKGVASPSPARVQPGPTGTKVAVSFQSPTSHQSAAAAEQPEPSPGDLHLVPYRASDVPESAGEDARPWCGFEGDGRVGLSALSRDVVMQAARAEANVFLAESAARRAARAPPSLPPSSPAPGDAVVSHEDVAPVDVDNNVDAHTGPKAPRDESQRECSRDEDIAALTAVATRRAVRQLESTKGIALALHAARESGTQSGARTITVTPSASSASGRQRLVNTHLRQMAERTRRAVAEGEGVLSALAAHTDLPSRDLRDMMDVAKESASYKREVAMIDRILQDLWAE